MEEPLDLYDVARMVTDEVLGAGAYAEINAHHPDPGVQAAIARSLGRKVDDALMEADTLIVRTLGPDDWERAPGPVLEVGGKPTTGVDTADITDEDPK